MEQIKNISKQNIITIDGPAGSGKSTVAHILSQKLNWVHVNTGAIYRTFGLLMHRLVHNNAEHETSSSFHSEAEQLALNDTEKISKVAQQLEENYNQNDEQHEFFLGTENITTHIHTPHISHLASFYAQNSLVREKLLPIQRGVVDKYRGVIVDGRDMGTVIFPFAPLKIYLTADVKTRAQRRFDELQERGINEQYDKILNEMQERDTRDLTRKISPTKPADDAIMIDSSNHTVNEIVEKIYTLAKDKKI